uniref:Uncharacterized protein n=1 Tax=Ulva compressa TaxID=63659 RepID=A0A3S6P804_ULVCO|nr:hypothetical protein [Ulva compressa]ATP01496.1 hypothetical protein [Ulva compressa]
MQEPPKDLNFVNLLTNANNKNITFAFAFLPCLWLRAKGKAKGKDCIDISIKALIVLLQNIAMGNLQETINIFCYG